MGKIQPKRSGSYRWFKVSFSYTSTFHNILSCYGRIWVDDEDKFPPDDRFILIEDIVLPMKALEEKKRQIQSDTNLVAIKNLKNLFPGSDGRLYVNTYQLASIMPLDPEAQMVNDLNRVITVSTLPEIEDESILAEELSPETEKIVKINRPRED